MSIIGIDLGTTNSACSVWENGESTLVPNRLGKSLTPSVVGIDKQGDIIVGEAAKERLVTHPKSTTALFKRYMGSEHEIFLSGKKYSAIELSALVLKSLKEDAEHYLNTEVTEAIISVPAYFNDVQRKATKQAGELAGLKVDRLINEPTAAAMQYGLHDQEDDTQFLILDLGGGTFDVSLVEYFDGVLEVHASSGDNSLGGDDFLQAILTRYLDDNQIKLNKLTLTEHQTLLSRLEQAKLALSKEGTIQLENLIPAQTSPWELSQTLFEKIAEPLLQRMRLPIERTVNDANVTPDDINKIILVGGATRMPMVRSLVAKMFGRMPAATFDPDLVVALGAGVQAALKSRQAEVSDMVLTDVSPYTLGTGVINENDYSGKQGLLFLPLIQRNSTVPTSIEKIVYAAEDYQTKVIIDIYQGESRLVKNNIYLGELEVTLPRAKKGEVPIKVRYSYDMNGLLEVDVTVEGSQIGKEDKIYQTTIINHAGSLSEKEIAESRKKLAKLKFHPRETEENRLLINKAERLYETALGDKREYIGRILSQFEAVLDSQDTKAIEKFSNELNTILNDLDNAHSFD